MKSTRTVLVVAILGTVLACSSDETADDTSGDLPCVKVTYPATDAGAGHEASCPDYPAACTPTDDPCHGDNPDCNAAVEALCGSGTRMHGCVSASLNDRAASLEIFCEHQPSDD